MTLSKAAETGRRRHHNRRFHYSVATLHPYAVLVGRGGGGRSQFQWCLIAIILVAAPCVILYCLRTRAQTNGWLHKQGENHSSANLQRQKKKNHPILKRNSIGGVEFLWQTPTNGTKNQTKAILFLAHGCSHSMKDWFAPDSDSTAGAVCPECIGLPEERAIVRIALDLELLVVAVSSAAGSCWSVTDGPRVARVLEEVNRDIHLPIYAFGASSGGSFVSSVLGPVLSAAADEAETNHGHRRLNGYISQIAAPNGDQQLESIPSVFITMNRDGRTDQRAAETVQTLRSRQVPVQHIRLPPLPITPDFFTERIGPQYSSAERSQRMVESLRDHGWVDDDKEDGLLTRDPRQHSDWRQVLAPFASEVGDSMVADESALSEVLNCAYGMHEMSRDGVREALTFLLAAAAD